MSRGNIIIAKKIKLEQCKITKSFTVYLYWRNQVTS